MNDEQIKVLLKARENTRYIDDSDSGQAISRVTARMLTEVLGLPLKEAPLINERRGEQKPLYCPSQYT
jgi:hypothetical protein